MRHSLTAFFVATLATGAFAQASFQIPYALDFDGENDRVVVPYSASFPTEVFTVSAWIRTQGAVRRKAIVARGEDAITGNAAWNLYMQPDGTFALRIEDINDADYSYPSGAHIADNKWHHLVATRNASGRVALYSDGQLAASFASSGIPSSASQQDLTFGCTHGTFGPPSPTNPVKPLWFFPGRIDEPSIWNISLSSAQVQALYTGGVDPLAAGLVGFWRMDEGRGKVVGDDSSSGTDGYRGDQPMADSADPKWVRIRPFIIAPR